MRIAAIVVLIVTALAMPVATFAAEMEYYVVLGGEADEEAAMSQWQALSEKHQELVGGLPFNPKTVLRMDGTVATRFEVGPVDRRAKAEKICDKLFADSAACFILEGEKLPPEERQKIAEFKPAPVVASAQPLPWLTEPVAAPKAQEPEPENRGFFDWLFGGDSSSEKEPQAEAAAPTKAEVEVAEAIRVPLTDNPPAAEIVPPPSIRPVFQPAENSGPSGWLNVYAFASEESADAFWQNVRAADPTRAAGLRVRTVKPLAERDGATASLNIGPFPGRETAEAFCRGSIEPVNRDLTCRFELSEPQAESRLVMPRYQHAERYEERRRQIFSQREATRADAALVPAMPPAKLYWVQVVTAPDQVEALNAWKAMRAANADLLEGLHTRIATSLMRESGYIVRVGPLKTSEDAAKLCASLKGRGVDCRVYSN